MSVVLLQPQCSAALEGGEREEEERGKKKTLRSADSLLHAIPKGPSEKGGGRVREKGKVKGVGDCKREGKKNTHPLSVARESPKG